MLCGRVFQPRVSSTSAGSTKSITGTFLLSKTIRFTVLSSDTHYCVMSRSYWDIFASPSLYFPEGRRGLEYTCLHCTDTWDGHPEQPSAVQKPTNAPIGAEPGFSSWCWPPWISTAVVEGQGRWITGFWYKTEEPFSWIGPPESFVALPAAEDQIDSKLIQQCHPNFTTEVQGGVHEGLRELWHHRCGWIQHLGRHSLGKCAEYSQTMDAAGQFEIKYTNTEDRESVVCIWKTAQGSSGLHGFTKFFSCRWTMHSSYEEGHSWTPVHKDFLQDWKFCSRRNG